MVPQRIATTHGLLSRLPKRLLPTRTRRGESPMPVALKRLLNQFPPRLSQVQHRTLTLTWAETNLSPQHQGYLMPPLERIGRVLDGGSCIRSLFIENGWLRIRIDW